MKLVLGALACLLALSLFVERVYFVNAPTYPQGLAQDLGKITSFQQLDPIRKAECSSTTIEIYPKKNGWFMRCGSIWYTGHTFYSSTDPYGDIREKL